MSVSKWPREHAQRQKLERIDARLLTALTSGCFLKKSAGMHRQWSRNEQIWAKAQQFPNNQCRKSIKSELSVIA